MKRLIIAVLFFSCSGKQSPDPDPTPDTDEKVEFTHKQGLTDTFSYRRLTWGAAREQIQERMQSEPKHAEEKNGVTLLTFATTTQGIETSLTMGLLDATLVTIDIAPRDPAQCEKAVPNWTKALTIKYGTATETTEKYVVWKLADASRIVVESGETCNIVYAKDAKTRVDVTNRLTQ